MLRARFLLFVLLFPLLLCWSCQSSPYPHVPSQYHALLDSALLRAGGNAAELRYALAHVPATQAEGLAFLIAYMPERDLTTLPSDFLLENVAYAYRARERFAWGASIPQEVFFNDVLPYVSMNERRDNWRKDFYERFARYLDGVTDLAAAIDTVNQHICKELGVKYDTAREKPDQSPYESMRQNMASCSGLAILLTDAFRAVGIPSRVAGTPNWYDDRGNHSWNEVWLGGGWHFTEYYPSGLDQSWFLSSAGRANPNDSAHAIYATSYRPTGRCFPLVWDSTITYVHAENVTQRYIDLFEQEQVARRTGDYIEVRVTYLDPLKSGSDRRTAVNVDVFDCLKGQIDGGRTLDGTHDLNEMLTFRLLKHHPYLFLYFHPDGTEDHYEFTTKEEDAVIELP